MATIPLPDLRTRLRLDASGFDQGTRKVKRSLGDISRGFTSTSSLLTGGFIAAGASVIKLATDVDLGLRKVNSLFGETGVAAERSFEAMRGQLRELSDDIGVAQDNLVEGLYQAISAGVPRDNAFTFMDTAAKAAIAGVTDTNTAVEGLSKSINAFGLDFNDAEHVADSMFTTVNKGIVTFEELSQHMYNAAPAAAAAGVSLEETNAALTALTLAGIPMAESATRVQAALSAMARKGEQLNPIFEALGFESAEAAVRQKGLKFALDAIYKAAGGSQSALLKYLGRVEAVQAVNVLAGNGADKFTQAIKDQAEATGAANKAFQEIEKSGARRFEKSLVRVKNAAIELGADALPVFASLAEGLSGTVAAAAALPTPVKAGVAALLLYGPASRVLATMAGQVKKLRDLYIGLRVAIAGGNIASGLRALAVPAGALASVALLSASWNELQRRQEEAKASLNDFLPALQKSQSALDENLRNMLRNKIAEKGLLDEIKASGVSVDRVIASLAGEIALTAEETKKLDDAPGNFRALGQALNPIATGFRQARVQANLLRNEQLDGIGASQQWGKVTGGATEKVRSALGGVADEAKEAASALDEYKKALDATLGVELDYDKAQLALKESRVALNASLKENGRTIDLHTKKGRENRRAVIDQVEAIQSEALAWAKKNDKEEDADAINKRMKDSVDALARKYPFLKGFLDDYLDSLKEAIKHKVIENKLKITVPEVNVVISNLKKKGAQGFAIKGELLGYRSYHTGGQLPGPSGREQLILAKSKERVLTEEQDRWLLKVAGARSPVTIHAPITVTGVRDPEKAASLVEQAVRRIAREELGAHEDRRADIARMRR